MLAVLACVPTLAESVRHNREINRLDSRLVSYHWIVSNMPADARILVDAKVRGLEHGEIAAALSKSVDAVKQTASRSLRRLREAYALSH